MSKAELRPWDPCEKLTVDSVHKSSVDIHVHFIKTCVTTLGFQIKRFRFYGNGINSWQYFTPLSFPFFYVSFSVHTRYFISHTYLQTKRLFMNKTVGNADAYSREVDFSHIRSNSAAHWVVSS